MGKDRPEERCGKNLPHRGEQVCLVWDWKALGACKEVNENQQSWLGGRAENTEMGLNNRVRVSIS